MLSSNSFSATDPGTLSSMAKTGSVLASPSSSYLYSDPLYIDSTLTGDVGVEGSVANTDLGIFGGVEIPGVTLQLFEVTGQTFDQSWADDNGGSVQGNCTTIDTLDSASVSDNPYPIPTLLCSAIALW